MKKIINKNDKGITLIALVITIIVLLILAGVAISMLSGENGILNQAAKAKTETEEASTDEAVQLAAMSALTAGQGKVDLGVLNSELTEVAGKEINIKELSATVTIKGKDYLIKTDGTVEEVIKVEKYVGKEVTGDKVTLTDNNGEQIVVPVGFKIKEDSPITVKQGIVVVAPDENGSEFVWVPVKDVSTMYGTNSEGTKLGKLYDWNNLNEDGTPTNLNWTETEGAMKWGATSGTGSYREPDYLTNGDASTTANRGIDLLKKIVGLTGSNSEILKQWQTNLQNEFDEMIKYVGENKGFYVGRYETSLNASGYAQSISGATSATAAADSANTWYGLYKVEKEYSKKEYETGKTLDSVVGSSMIWGSQYDQMLFWMQSNGIDVTSETPINLEGVTTSKNFGTGSAVGTTGTVETDKLNNIYDLLGNSHEWTLEANNTFSRVYRGGNWYISERYSPSYRYGRGSPDNTAGGISSRLALYVK